MREKHSISTAPGERRTLPGRRAFTTLQGSLIGLILLVLVPFLLSHPYLSFERYEYRKEGALQANLEIARAVAKGFETFAGLVRQSVSSAGMPMRS